MLINFVFLTPDNKSFSFMQMCVALYSNVMIDSRKYNLQSSCSRKKYWHIHVPLMFVLKLDTIGKHRIFEANEKTFNFFNVKFFFFHLGTFR